MSSIEIRKKSDDFSDSNTAQNEILANSDISNKCEDNSKDIPLTKIDREELEKELRSNTEKMERITRESNLLLKERKDLEASNKILSENLKNIKSRIESFKSEAEITDKVMLELKSELISSKETLKHKDTLLNSVFEELKSIRQEISEIKSCRMELEKQLKQLQIDKRLKDRNEDELAETKQKLKESEIKLRTPNFVSNARAVQFDLVEFHQKLPNGQTEFRSNKCDLCGRICMNYQGMRVHRAACKKKKQLEELSNLVRTEE